MKQLYGNILREHCCYLLLNKMVNLFLEEVLEFSIYITILKSIENIIKIRSDPLLQLTYRPLNIAL